MIDIFNNFCYHIVDYIRGANNMDVILLQDVKGSGKKGDIIKVNDGFARNFLIPKKLAQPATNSNINENKQAKEAKAYHKQVELDKYRAEAQKLQGTNITITMKIGDNGKLFGSVTSKEIAEALNKQGNVVEKKMLVVPTIKLLGKYEIKAKYAEGIEAKFFVTVESQ